MTYSTPKSHDHGVINFGCNSYGGLAYSDSFYKNLDLSGISDSEASTSFVDDVPKIK